MLAHVVAESAFSMVLTNLVVVGHPETQHMGTDLRQCCQQGSRLTGSRHADTSVCGLLHTAEMCQTTSLV